MPHFILHHLSMDEKNIVSLVHSLGSIQEALLPRVQKPSIFLQECLQYAGSCSRRLRVSKHIPLSPDWNSLICRKSFCAAVGIGYRTLQHRKQEVCSDSPSAHGNSGKAPLSALSKLDKMTVVRFIRHYAAVHALPDPGRLQGKTRDFVLESNHTMKSLYGEYGKAMEDSSRRVLQHHSHFALTG